jgi:phage-related protein
LANDEIGDVSVGVSADARGLPAELKSKVTPAGLSAGDQLADALSDAFAAAAGSAVDEGLEEVKASVREMVKEIETSPVYVPDIEVELETDEARQELKRFAAQASAQTADLELDLETEAALAHLKAFAEEVDGYEPTVDLDVFLQDAKAHVDAFIQETGRRELEVYVDADTTPAKEAVVALKAFVKKQAEKIDVKADVKKAVAKIKVFLRDKTITIIPVVSGAALAAAASLIVGTLQAAALSTGIGSLAGTLLAGSAGLLSIGGSLAQILPLALAVPGVLIAAGAAIAPLIIGLKGVGKELGELSDLGAGLKFRIQDAFNAEAVKPLRAAIKELGPELQKFVGPVSSSLGALVGGLGLEFGKALGDGGLRGMLSNLVPAIDLLSKNNGVFVDTFVRLGQVGNDYLLPIAGFINEIGTGFNTWLTGVQASGELAAMIENAWFQTKELGRTLVATGGIFSGLADAARAGGAGGLTSFADILESIRDTINTPEFQSTLSAFFKASGVAASALGGAIGALGGMFTALKDPIVNLLAGGGSAFAGLLQTLFESLSTPVVAGGLQSAVTGMISVLDSIAGVLPTVIPLLTPVLTLFGTLGETVGPLVAAGLQGIAPVIGAIATALGPLVEYLGGGITDSLKAFGTGFTEAAGGASGFQGIIEGLAGGIAGMVNTLLPIVVQVLGQIVTAIVNSLPQVAASLLTMLPTIIQGVTDLITTFIGLIPTLLTAVLGAITTAMPMIGEGLATAIPQIIEAIVAVLPLITETVGTFLPLLIEAAMQLFLGLQTGLLTALPILLEGIVAALPRIIEAILTALPLMVTAALNLFLGLVNGLVQAMPVIISTLVSLIPKLLQVIVGAIPQILSAAVQLFLAIVKALATALPTIISSLSASFPQMASAIMRAVPQILSAGVQLFMALVTAILQTGPQVVSGISALIPQIGSAISGAAGTLRQAGVNMIQGLISGIGSMVGSVVSRAREVASAAANAVKSFLKIKSPSRVMMALGRYTVQGFADGIKGTQKQVASAMRAMANKVVDSYNAKIKTRKLITPASKGKKAVYQTIITEQFSSKAVEAIKRWIKKENVVLQGYARQKESLAKQLKVANKNLADQLKAKDTYRKGQIDDILKGASVADDKSVERMIKNLRKQTAQTVELTQTLYRLKKMGVDSTTYAQLADGGLDSLKSAKALLAGGKDAVSKVGYLQKKLKQSATSFGSTTSNAMYDAGIQAARGIVAGIQSQEKAIAKAMTTTANNLVKAIKKTLGIKSPATVLRDQVGKMIGAGIISGVEAMRAAVNKSVAGLVDVPEVDPRRNDLLRNRNPRAAGYASTTTNNNGTTVQLGGVHVIESSDPAQAAQEFVNRIAKKVGLR